MVASSALTRIATLESALRGLIEAGDQRTWYLMSNSRASVDAAHAALRGEK